MKNVFHKKGWHTGSVKIYVDPPSIQLITSNNDTKVEKYFVKTIV